MEYLSSSHLHEIVQKGYCSECGVHVDVRYVPITSHVPFGKVISATPNGRKTWTALSDGSSASHGLIRTNPQPCCFTTIIPKTMA